ncbi:SDR family oxidoreductase [Ottowia sp.]|uniref:SDR family oxidoreductase n=1 Tax=Ottowia sp. TaxID=1898956 RepID=UPI0025D620A6|nr:SDR family oxidoreductase [Ottowia sp.]
MAARPCLITGASGNIGEAIALRLIADGRPVALTHSPRGAPSPSISGNEQVRWYPLEVRDDAAVQALVGSIESDFGAVPDLVYCAGITGDAAIPRITNELWESVIGTNLSGAFYTVRALATKLMVAGDGRIVFIGSVSASKGNPGQMSYAASKGALEAMAREVAVEMGRFGVTCNVVSPGLIEGRMVGGVPDKTIERYVRSSPLRQIGKPVDVANLVSLLMSAEGRYITGQTIQIDGGLTAM